MGQGPFGPFRELVDPRSCGGVAYMQGEYTTISVHTGDKERLDAYIEEHIGTDPESTPYRVALNHLIDAVSDR